jgi:hypothetical protein
MHIRKISGWLAALVVYGSFSGSFATADLVEQVQAALYAGQTGQAASAAKSRLADVPGDAQARFALGAVQFLQAIENLGQGLYRYGLRSSYQADLVY